MTNKISIILPACNEEIALAGLLPELIKLYPDAEILVVDDGSTDRTAEIGKNNNIRVISHPYVIGNGAAVKTGARAATGDILVFMDGDGQHSAVDVAKLLDAVENGFDMAVAARSTGAHANILRFVGNSFYNRLASWITGHRIVDLTSGFRAVKKDRFSDFLNILPNGFSYPTTITIAFFRVGYAIKYVPVNVKSDVGASHIRPFSDGIRFLLIIFRIAVLYSPLKVFLPISFGLFCTGMGYYLYTFFTQARLTNMTILVLLSSLIVFLIGLVSEQITFLIYNQNHKK